MKNKTKQIISVVTACTGDHVAIGEAEINHALAKHFRIPKLKLLEIVEQILRDPTEVFVDNSSKNSNVKSYLMFYRLDDGGYLVVVVKVLPEGAFFSTVYPTGSDIRKAHKKLKKVKK